MKKIIVVFSLLFTSIAFSQDNFIVEKVRLFDGKSVQENMSVNVKNGLIVKVQKGKIKNRGAIRFDGMNKTLIPALTNAHVHVWSPASLREAAKAGVLNVLDMAGNEQMQVMLRTFKDSINYASFFAAGGPATAPEGHGTQFGYSTPTLSKVSEAKGFIKSRVVAGADYIKIIVEPSRKTLNLETVKALINETHEQNKIAVVHVSYVKDAFDVLNNGADGLVHIWRDTILTDNKLKMLTRENSFFVIPTLLTAILARKAALKKNPDNQGLSEKEIKSEVKRLYLAGVKILAGTDPPNLGINNGTDLYKELKLLTESGIPTIEVLKSATSYIADAFGLEKKGEILPGYRADMILIDGNPLDTIEDISNVKIVWKNGIQVKL